MEKILVLENEEDFIVEALQRNILRSTHVMESPKFTCIICCPQQTREKCIHSNGVSADSCTHACAPSLGLLARYHESGQAGTISKPVYTWIRRK